MVYYLAQLTFGRVRIPVLEHEQLHWRVLAVIYNVRGNVGTQQFLKCTRETARDWKKSLYNIFIGDVFKTMPVFEKGTGRIQLKGWQTDGTRYHGQWQILFWFIFRTALLQGRAAVGYVDGFFVL